MLGADRLLRPWLAGRGAIFVLHRVAPAGAQVMDPDMTITVDVLDAALRLVRAEGYDLVGLDDVPARLRRSRGPRFAVFTFDDGYRDNLTMALPILRAHRVPFCLYVTTGLIDRAFAYWWGALARLIEARPEIDLRGLGEPDTLPIGAWAEKQAAYARIQAWVHEDLERRGPAVLQWCERLGVDAARALDEDALSWDEIRSLARDPLVTIGAHTVSHPQLAHLDDDAARRELVESRARIEVQIGRRVHHLAYPYGGPGACGPREFRLAAEAGYTTATTTRQGNLFAVHADRPMALPRRRLTEGEPDLRTARRALSGTAWFLRRGQRIATA